MLLDLDNNQVVDLDDVCLDAIFYQKKTEDPVAEEEVVDEPSVEALLSIFSKAALTKVV